MEYNNKVLANRYRIDEKVGEGGMAQVYRGYDLKLDRTIAIKILKREYRKVKDFVNKFEIEARHAASLNHINIVSIYDVGEDQELNYIVMEYLDGKTLKEYIVEKRGLSNEETVKISGAIASALIAAHNNNIIHRDIKPQNVMITDDAKIKVMDFGIAKMRKEDTMTRMARGGDTIDAEAAISGSIHYMAPEVLKSNYSDERSDIYALGITMFEMITGIVPFDGNSDINIALKHINDSIPDIRALNDEVKPALEQIIIKCTHKNADERYQSARDLLADLKNIIKAPSDLFIKIEKREALDRSKTKIKNHKASEVIQQSNRISNIERKQKEKQVAFFGALTGALLAIVLAVLIISLNKEVIFPTKIEMKNLSEMNKDQYTQFFEDNEIEWEVVGYEFNDIIEKDGVIEQSIEPGLIITKKDKVKLVLSKGKKLFSVPNVVNLEYETAVAMIESSNLTYEINRVYDDNVVAGLVIKQSPEKKTMLEEGSTVVLDVSLGAQEKFTTMPDITNMTLKEGEKALKEAKLERGTISEAYNDKVEKGKIIATTILPNEEVKEGYVVDITISLGKENKAVTKTIKVENILSSEDVAAKLKVVLLLDGKATEIYNADVTQSSFDNPIEIEVKGKGSGKYEVYKNDVLLFTNNIAFTTED